MQLLSQDTCLKSKSSHSSHSAGSNQSNEGSNHSLMHRCSFLVKFYSKSPQSVKPSMSGKTKTLWQYLPDLILGEIMVMLMGLEKLQKCRQVCQKWNVMISQMTKNKKNIIWSKADSTRFYGKWWR